MKDISHLSENEQKAVLARREYQRIWRANNKERVKAIQDRFYLRKKSAEKANSG